MKIRVLLLMVTCSSVVFSQQKSFNIDWKPNKFFSTVLNSIELPFFQETNYDYNPNEGIVFFAEWTTSNIIDEQSVQLINVSYQTLSDEQLGDLKKKDLPKQPIVKLFNVKARENRSVMLRVSPIINDKGTIKRINSFTVSYSTNNYGVNSAQSSPQIIQSSVLSSGQWYKFYVEESGIYRLSKSFLNQLGINTNNVDPREIKIFGNGGKMLPMANDASYPIDLTENAIKFVGEEDGSFDNGDYILFYAEGPQGDVSDSNINTNLNPYTDRAHYFVNISPGLGKRIQEMQQPSGLPNLIVNTFRDYQFHEADEYNIAKLGRRWFGDRFGIENEKTFEFEFPNIVATEPVVIKIYVAATSEGFTSMEVLLDGNNLTTLNFLPVNGNVLASESSYTGQILPNSENFVFDFTYNNGGLPSSYAYLDYISLEATRELVYANEQMIFENPDVANVSGIVQYNLSNASTVDEVWDITDKYNVTSVVNEQSNEVFDFKASAGSQRTYITVSSSDFLNPKRGNTTFVTNQDIKGTVLKNSQGLFQDVDYIIVTPNNLVSQAERLAQINRAQYGLTVKVLTLNEIYNEFSSGNQDVGAIRNMVRYVYHNASSAENRLKYLCLFGDASFDYKDRLPNNTNVVPSWYSYESFSLSNSFVSDDFYGMMDSNEGNMLNSDKLDIAVGRILVEDLQQAKEMVDKIETYYKPSSYGSWRNNFIVISDDVDEDWEGILQETSNEIADQVTQNKPFLNPIKIFSDAYQQQSSSSGDTYPDVNIAIKNAVEVGALVVNYFGHGGEDGLANERIFDKNDSQEIKNTCKYNCFVTVTCEYTKFDDPTRPTAGEYVYWNTEGGAIGLITTTRQIFVSVGISFNLELNQHLFAYGTNEYPSMAEALRLTKTSTSISGISQRHLVFFIGDPAMKLAFPKPSVNLTHINDQPVSNNTDTLRALDKVKLSGEVVDETGNLLSNYNGIITITVFDKNIERETLANNGVVQNGELVKLNFETLGEIIFKGKATVTNGVFDVEFVVPKDIGVPVGQGKVSFYAQTELPLQDQAGASFDVEIGGINENAEEDNVGPVIKLYMNDENFVSGGITNEEPTLLAKLEDENGINTASGIGHDIVAILDGDEANPIVLNNYYQANIDDYKSGEVTYPLRDLEPGLHTLTLKAWDVYNNSSTTQIEFVVYDKDEKLIINNVLNYPNPFVDYTEFWFNHNSSTSLDVSIQIFTISGKLVRTLNGQTGVEGCCNNGQSSLSRDIIWDGRDDFGEKIGKGVYIYKLKVRSPQLNKQVEKVEKLVIL